MSDCVSPQEMLSPFEYELYKMRIWAGEVRAPISLTIELTPYCNFNCPMCYVHLTPEMAKKKGTMLTAAQWLEIMRQFADLGLMIVNVSGGEPLVRPDFWEIYEGICQLGIYPDLFSNGYLIDEKVVERLKEYPPRQVKISVYGTCDETYEKMCGVKHGFTRMSRAVDLLKAADIPVVLTTTIVKQNVQDVPFLDAFGREKGIRIAFSAGTDMTARGSLNESGSAWFTDSPLAMTLEELEKKKHKPVKSLYEKCGSYGRSGVITWHGHLQTCTLIENEYIPLAEPYNIADSWKAMWDKADAAKLPAECNGCPDAEFCEGCPGQIAGVSGYIDRINPVICRQAAIRHKRYDELRAGNAEKQ